MYSVGTELVDRLVCQSAEGGLGLEDECQRVGGGESATTGSVPTDAIFTRLDSPNRTGRLAKQHPQVRGHQRRFGEGGCWTESEHPLRVFRAVAALRSLDENAPQERIFVEGAQASGEKSRPTTSAEELVDVVSRGGSGTKKNLEKFLERRLLRKNVLEEMFTEQNLFANLEIPSPVDLMIR